MNSSGYQPPPVVTYCHCAAEDTWLYFLTYLFLAFYTFLVHCKSAETDRHTHTESESPMSADDGLDGLNVKYHTAEV